MSDNLSLPVRYHKMKSVVNPVYDKVVDRTDFKRGQDKERNMRLAGDTGGSTTQGVYDYPDGEVNEKNSPTDVILALRSGRLDKADIDTIKRSEDLNAKNEREESKKNKTQKQKEAIASARQSYIDSRTGFDSASVKSE